MTQDPVRHHVTDIDRAQNRVAYEALKDDEAF
jgi:hypothetical protein